MPNLSGPRPFILAAGLSIVLTGLAVAQFASNAEHEAIAYSTSTPTDPVARLQARIAAGEVSLSFDERRGYLPAVLKALDIPIASQGLVFSRTSLQLDRIAPWSPRAIYFNDDVYVGWVQGGPILEFASVDPKLGTIFYSLPQQPSAKPEFVREGSTCLVCHDSSSITGGVPGLIVRSVLPDRHGYSITAFRDGPTTDQTPIATRWGGWYVTGAPSTQSHMGNVIAPALAHEVGNVQQYLAKNNINGGTVTDLSDRFDTEPYLTDQSDAVALLVLAHQTHVHNLITIAGYETRKALYDESLASNVEKASASEHSPATLNRIKVAAEPLVRAMLFVKEAPFDGAIKGRSGFAEQFVAAGPRDRKSRSLRDLDLERRLFRYPLSYLVYSESFNALPDIVKQHVYQRLRQVLRGDDPAITHIAESDRQAILEILEETKPDFAASTLAR